ncbi:MAG: lipocalin family protein [Desulfobacterales bacterium]|jgi:apolipoprotein D and lipocalin family protein|nr:MAG: lipocalin family protein [Desulfobacterales bacterium]UCG80299.1 MAG: lipocalin family protein [Desulfobacterales bacterium]
MRRLFLLTCLFVTGCVGIPDNITAVDGFEVKRYLGTWYEIARLDHSFERGLSNITATYTLRDDGGIDVLNKGFDKEAGKWKRAEGKAYLVSTPDVGRLKVSFFGPFYGGYNIIALDKENYSYSLVCSQNRSYLWILARDKELEQDTLGHLIELSKGLGFETDKLIFVDHADKLGAASLTVTHPIARDLSFIP